MEGEIILLTGVECEGHDFFVTNEVYYGNSHGSYSDNPPKSDEPEDILDKMAEIFKKMLSDWKVYDD